MTTYTGNYAQLMAEYNRWMNERLYAACDRLSDKERKRDRGAFFKSIHATLNHLLLGDRLWLSRFNGKHYEVKPIGVDLYDDFSELRAARVAMDQDIIDWAAGVNEQWLNEPMTWTSQTYGFTQTQPHRLLVTQMFNHQTHHRGQVTTLLSQRGIDMGPTDIQALPMLTAGL
jgi:uncharacterized damage-inducible protein DinB